jgi:hypothetical protein
MSLTVPNLYSRYDLRAGLKETYRTEVNKYSKCRWEYTYMIKIKPNLPEPTRKPPTLFASAADGFFVKRRLLPRCIKIDYREQPVLRG